jgi:hypothetical protein
MCINVIFISLMLITNVGILILANKPYFTHLLNDIYLH